MSDLAIRVENLGKEYRIGGKRERYKALRDTIADSVAAPLRRIGKLLRGQAAGAADMDEVIWSLRNVSFEVKRGDVVGVIGRNGAGKSTLLKVLSRITEPTEGYADIYGRVGSLLEVGTGFHPELTGHENIYLNGAILGMKRGEIDRKYDEIVTFAEVEKFIDTPVKHFSSGMYLRLAFAVAAHMEPDILLVDEVLAVGDAAFQKKCLGKMGEVAKEGRTVLFVSHNMGAIANLCHNALLLNDGQITHTGPSAEVISQYLDMITERDSGEVLLVRTPNDAYFTRVAILEATGQITQSIEVMSDFKIHFEYEIMRPIAGLEVSFSLFDRYGSIIFYTGLSKSKTVRNLDHEPGHYIVEVHIPKNFLAPGIYSIAIALHQPNIRFFDQRDHVIGFSVVETGSEDYKYAGQGLGSILVQFDWTVQKSYGKN